MAIIIGWFKVDQLCLEPAQDLLDIHGQQLLRSQSIP